MRNLFIILLATLTFYFISCNNDEVKKGNQETVQLKDSVKTKSVLDFFTSKCSIVSGVGNLILRTSLSDSMTKHFDTIYKRDDNHNNISLFNNSYWIDSCTINSVGKYLSANGCDGIRVYFGCSIANDTEDPTQQYKKKTTLCIFPTKYRATSVKNQSTHKDTLVEMPSSCGLIKSEYIKKPGLANSQIAEFNKIYRKFQASPRMQKDSLSQSIWIDKCVIDFLQILFRSYNNRIDGINIRAAAYFPDFDVVGTGKFKPNQSTIIIVPSKPSGGSAHIDDWSLIDEIITIVKPKGGFNHGELCPQICQ